MSLTVSGSREDHFPWEMTNQSHYSPINMMEEMTLQTCARTTPAPSVRPAAADNNRCGDPQHLPVLKGSPAGLQMHPGTQTVTLNRHLVL